MFFGFIGKEAVAAGQTNHLLSLGLITYEYICLRDEKIRLGVAF